MAEARDDQAPAPKRAKTNGDAEEYKCNAADVVRFHLVEACTNPALAQEIDAGGASDFACEYYHQVFGEEEEIMGYKDLSVDIWLSAGTYQAWVDIRYANKRKGADDILGSLKEAFPAGFATSRKDFEAAVLSAAVPKYGDCGRNIARVQMEDGSTLLLQHCKLAEAPEAIKAVHKRVEPLVLFTIDGGTAIDAEDERWEVILAVLHDDAGETPDLVAGFATIYNFYAWPVRTRPRLAQVLVVPPYQGMGIGKAMLRAAYGLAQDRDATDLTFEDPSPNLQRLREKVDLEMMLATPWVVELAQQQVAAATSGTSTSGGEPQQATAEASDTNGQPASNGSNGHAQAKRSRRKSWAKGPLALSADATARLAAELKIHPKQVAPAWEALLLLQPGMTDGSSGRVALEALVTARLEAEQLAPVDKEGAAKRIVDVQGGKEEDFFMWRPRKGDAEPTADGAGAAGDTAAAGSSAHGAAAEGAATLNVGRHNITQVTAEERAEQLRQLLEERMAQLDQLCSLMAK